MKSTVSLLAAAVIVLLPAGRPEADAQQAAGPYRIGFVSHPLPVSPEPATLHAFRQRLRGTAPALAAKKATTTVPIVFASVIDPVAPGIQVKVDLLDAGNTANLEKAFAVIEASGAQGIVVAGDPFFTGNAAKLVGFAARKRLPAVYFFKPFVDAGGLMAYGASLEDYYRRAATYVDKILKGAKPADLPVEQPTEFELSINLKAARALGLAIPQALLLRADHVIE